jgi:murein DD-endopeptidase MepM/ murein hydrolase activator NlpD
MSTRFQRNPSFALRSLWGGRIDPISGEGGKFHSGHDYAAKAGTPIPAEIAGEVVYSGFNDKLGNTVIVKHHTGGYSLYGHMQDSDRVQVGQPVWQGDVVGRVGSTGARSTGNHVHYTLIDGNVKRQNTRTGSIGVALNEVTTIDPEKFDIDPRYLNETSRSPAVSKV